MHTCSVWDIHANEYRAIVALLSEYKTVNRTPATTGQKLPNVGLEAAILNRVGNNPRKIGVIVVNSRI